MGFHIIMESSENFDNMFCDLESIRKDFPPSRFPNGCMNNVGNMQLVSSEHRVRKPLALDTMISLWKKGMHYSTAGDWQETVCWKRFKCFNFCSTSYMLRNSSSVLGMSSKKRCDAPGSMLGGTSQSPLLCWRSLCSRSFTTMSWSPFLNHQIFVAISSALFFCRRFLVILSLLPLLLLHFFVSISFIVSLLSSSRQHFQGPCLIAIFRQHFPLPFPVPYSSCEFPVAISRRNFLSPFCHRHFPSPFFVPIFVATSCCHFLWPFIHPHFSSSFPVVISGRHFLFPFLVTIS